MPNALHRSWWKKRIALNLYLKRDLLKAKLLHVTSTVELAAIKKLKINVPAMVIPLGCDAPSDISRICTNRRSMLFLSRISPEKGLKNLILAWAELSTEGWDLIIAGPDWRGHVAEIRNLVDARALRNIYFLGAVYGQEKDKLFRSADVFVLPSLTENFAAVVVEALSYGVPVITTTGTPWVVLEEEGCGWCAELTVASLKNKMKEALSTELPVLKAMGNKGRLFVEHNFAWPTIANRFVKLYTECVAVSENNI